MSNKCHGIRFDKSATCIAKLFSGWYDTFNKGEANSPSGYGQLPKIKISEGNDNYE